jgi:hypothetical protein
MLAITHLLGDWRLVPVLCLASSYAAFAGYLLLEPEVNVGHRAGSEGFEGGRGALLCCPACTPAALAAPTPCPVPQLSWCAQPRLQAPGTPRPPTAWHRRNPDRRRAVREHGGGAAAAG